MQKPSWYRTWFNSPYYHILYRDRDEREAALFIDRVMKYFLPPAGSKFLDLACGKGRHSVYINKKGFDVTGVDLSAESIKIAKKEHVDNLHFYVHDMRYPFANETFDYVFNLFTSFGYFNMRAENEAVLFASYQNLKPKGYLLIDFLNAEEVIHNLVNKEVKIIDDIEFSISRKHENGQIIKTIEIDDHGKKFEFVEKVAALTRADFIGMLNQANFEIHDIFGNYQLENFKAEISPRLIIIARKSR